MNPLQRAVVRRKISYFVAILALLTLSMLWRGNIAVGNPNRVGPPATAMHKAADWVGSHAIAPQATKLDLRELDQGDAEVSGEAIRLLLIGSRGVVTAIMWQNAIEKQKRGELADLELLVRAVTKLQPHFLSPWLFQSWNIAYNVSVDQHRLGDMYFYIARGIDLLAEGERRNNRSPDMPYWVGFSYQNKFGISDKVQTLRCLFQMSCIPKNQRSTARLLTKDGTVIDSEFQKFCEENPHLVRRLKEKLNCLTPLQVVEFLKENEDVPNRFKGAGDVLAAADQQFPVLPPQFDEGPDEWKAADPASDDDKSGFRAGRAWYQYAQRVVPPNPVWDDGRPIPAPSPKPGPPGKLDWDEYDSTRYRMPRSPMLIIFRQGPPRAQTYMADMENKEGWFDETGWTPDAGVDETNRWFPRRPDGRDVAFGEGHQWSLDAWRESHRRWQSHGEKNALIIDPGRLEAIREASDGNPNTWMQRPPAELWNDPEKGPEVRHRYIARVATFFFNQNRQVTNFLFFLTSSEAEMQPAAIVARKTLAEAERARKAGNTSVAIELYHKALERWKDWLSRYDDYRHETVVQEELFEAELKYVRLLAQDDPRVRDVAQKRYESAIWALGPFPAATPPAPDGVRTEIAVREFSPLAKPLPNGEPWVTEAVKDGVRSRLGTTTKAAPGTQSQDEP